MTGLSGRLTDCWRPLPWPSDALVLTRFRGKLIVFTCSGFDQILGKNI